jgi:hypothetical protein
MPGVALECYGRDLYSLECLSETHVSTFDTLQVLNQQVQYLPQLAPEDSAASSLWSRR